MNKDILKNITGFFGEKKFSSEKTENDGKGKNKLLLFLGLGGILLIFLSSMLPKGISNSKKNVAVNSMSAEQYAGALENKIETIVSSIVGSNKVKVLITLESGIEYVYANEVKYNSDSVDENSPDNKNKYQSKDSGEEKYVIINLPGGGEGALTVTELSPKIRGVVVACMGGDDELTAESVTSAVATALGIHRARVCVIGIK